MMLCPKCGLSYLADKDENNVWVECEGCEKWFDFKCTNIRSKRHLPGTFICEDCK